MTHWDLIVVIKPKLHGVEYEYYTWKSSDLLVQDKCKYYTWKSNHLLVQEQMLEPMALCIFSWNPDSIYMSNFISKYSYIWYKHMLDEFIFFTFRVFYSYAILHEPAHKPL